MYSFSLAQTAHMYSGAKTGLVTDVQREHQELKKQDQDTTDLGGTIVSLQGPLKVL
jgi:hypothetical protein